MHLRRSGEGRLQFSSTENLFLLREEITPPHGIECFDPRFRRSVESHARTIKCRLSALVYRAFWPRQRDHCPAAHKGTMARKLDARCSLPRDCAEFVDCDNHGGFKVVPRWEQTSVRSRASCRLVFGNVQTRKLLNLYVFVVVIVKRSIFNVLLLNV